MKKGKQFLIFISVLNLILLGVYGLFFYGIKIASEEASALSYDLEDKRANKDELSLLQHSLNETIGDREKLNSYFVRSSKIDAFIEGIISLGNESGSSITLSGLTESAEQTLTIDLRGTGTFNELYHFVKLVEHMPYHIEFKKLYINAQPAPEQNEKSQGKVSSRIWNASFTLTLFGFIKE